MLTRFLQMVMYHYLKSLLLLDYHLGSMKRLNIFVDMCIQNHTQIGSKISFYLSGNPTEVNFLSSDTLPFVEIRLTPMDIKISANCKYRNPEEKCTIPLVEKIREYNFEYANQKALEAIMQKK